MTDREDAIVLLKCSANELTETLENTTVESAILLLQRYIDAYNMGAAALRDQVTAKHGRWIEKPNPWGQDGSHSYDCSICGERTCVVGHKLRYCPNCGAKMDLEEETDD